jgi:DNA-binding NtrC family response regulator
VYGIVKQSGGHIAVYSEVGVGSSFKVYLPRVDQPVEAAVPDPAAVQDDRGSETILLVEDQAALRELFEIVLTRKGYRVLPAETPSRALELANSHTGVDVLMTDVILPGMNGPRLAEAVSRIHPQAHVLFVSAFTDAVIPQDGSFTSKANFLQKPFTHKDLTRKIREILSKQ